MDAALGRFTNTATSSDIRPRPTNVPTAVAMGRRPSYSVCPPARAVWASVSGGLFTKTAPKTTYGHGPRPFLASGQGKRPGATPSDGHGKGHCPTWWTAAPPDLQADEECAGGRGSGRLFGLLDILNLKGRSKVDRLPNQYEYLRKPCL